MDTPKLQISTQLLTQEAQARGWKIEVLDPARGLIRYHHPDGRIFTALSLITHYGSGLAGRIADDKWLLFCMLSAYDIPMLETALYDDVVGQELLHKYQKLVAKPRRDTAHGDGVSVNIQTPEALRTAVARAKEFSSEAIIQPMISGDDYRLLFINGRLAAAAIRRPAVVTGDGTQTVAALITQENQRPERGTNYQGKLNKINVEAAEDYLGEAMQAVPAAGEIYQVVGTANVGSGGTAVDVTDSIDSRMVELGERIVRNLNMPICGVDFMDDPVLGPQIIEINACPSLGLHAHPHEGTPRPVASIYLDWLESNPGDE
jgi:cyanophycin synthetase